MELHLFCTLHLTLPSQLMDNDIAPKLDKLKKEKADFLTFQKIEGEVERLRRLMVAYDYMKSKVIHGCAAMAIVARIVSLTNLYIPITQEKLNRSESDYADKQSMASALQLRCTDLESAITQIAADIELVLAQKERELKKSGQFQKLQDEVNEMANVLTRVNTQLGLKKRSVEEERESIQGQEANVEKVWEYTVHVYETGYSDIYIATLPSSSRVHSLRASRPTPQWRRHLKQARPRSNSRRRWSRSRRSFCKPFPLASLGMRAVTMDTLIRSRVDSVSALIPALR